MEKTENQPEAKGNIGTKEWVLLTALAVVALNYTILSTLQQLPSPIYGGDYWNHLGMLYHLYYGGSVLDNGQMAGEIPWVPWLYHLAMTVVAWVSTLDPLQAVIWANVPFIFLSAWLLYRIMHRFTDNIILIVAAMLPLLALYPIFKYTDFAFLVVGPALLLAWLRYREQPDRKNMLLLMGVMVIANLTSPQLLIASYIVFALTVAMEVHKKFGKQVQHVVTPDGIVMLKPYIAIFAVSFIGALLYWFWPLFVYQGHTPNDLFIYGWADFTKVSEQINFFFAVLGNWFWPFPISFGGVYRLALLVGAYFLVKNRMENKSYETAFIFFIAALVGVSHHFITFNLFHFHFDPGRPFQMLEMPLSVVQFVLAGAWLQKKIENKHVVVLLLLITGSMYYEAFTARQNDSYYLGAAQPLLPQMAELRQWIIANTNVNDVFLTDNEDAFMMNGLTGRKSVSYRRTHAPIYTDMNQRMLDSSIILYGNNDALREELLRKYRVKYLLWTIRWFDNQYQVTTEGQVAGFFDPFMVPYRSEYASYLQNNGVSYVQAHTYLDPAWIPSYPTYDVLVTMPASGDLFHPWNEGLDRHLTPVKQVGMTDANGNLIPFAIIYEVQYD